MRVYSIKYTEDVEIPLVPSGDVKDFTKGSFVRKFGEYEPCLFETKEKANKKIEEIAKDKGIDISSCEVVSMYIEESDALFCLFNIAFEIFPDFRKCVKVTLEDLI